ncbi:MULTISPECIES: UDP-glucose/GDP-mannose dehydrogenase family protein [unclassified Devosia]|uniref:UDP-glucose dehydrogenase family protein n=1 Tax=unclassified Devosia TaxID=196773 RepID=UPI00145D6C00|nr:MULTISPECIES: UDP-glucose/GDP-mannose dehydrogenase family protein [unclassified Devosia]MBK1793560.1 UDP-glucose/GDP-mannose dehydrogenase family protein [Devosia sp. WQ 349K1]
MKITVIGSGYVGLVSGVCFADFGHSVTCVDKDAAKIAALQSGIIPIYEPGLDQIVLANVEAGRLQFTTALANAVAEADVIFIAVGTPARRGDGHADLTYVYDVAREIAPLITRFTVVVTKSTVPVGTGDEVERLIRSVNPEADVAVVSNPEFLREGAAIADFKHPDRVVVGLEDERARSVMAEVYRPLNLNSSPLLFTSRRSAELIKYGANAFLAMKITFINEMASLCEAAGGDVQEVARGMGLDRRIGEKFLNAGPGFGGSCFPKDTQALVQMGREHASPMRLVEATVDVNVARKGAMAQRVIAACGGSVAGRTIGVLGLTFKPETDDMRDAPSLDIIAGLEAAGAHVRAYDPKGMAAARPLLPNVTLVDTAYEVADGASAVVLVTEWNEFRALDLAQLKSRMSDGLLVDLRNVYREADVAKHGLGYLGLGKPSRLP